MESKEKEITKICGFYVSDWHLVTMILPYINEKLNNGSKVSTILEKDISENVGTLLEKLNIENKEKILNIKWNKNNQVKLALNGIKEGQELIILINGDKEFIDEQNKKIQKYFKTHILINNIKIINLYEITQFNGSITEILDEHDKIINTSGEREISDVFQEYSDKRKAI